MKKAALIIVTFLLTMPTMVEATLVTTQPAGTPTVLTTVTDTWASAPSVVAGGFTVFAPSSSNVWYGDALFNLSENGIWKNFAWVGGHNDSGFTATIDLGGSYSAVGGFMNYILYNETPYGAHPLIEAIAADGTTVLEFYDLFTAANISTRSGNNAGAFRGISRGTADIAYLRLSGDFLIIHDLTLGGGTPVPEPGTMLLLGSGLVGLVGYGRRRFKK